ncbi:sensor histidine kinase [Actinoplanes sp. NPDC051851]|uniref:sensor histidine kinase n=1 Tax=Actinoplanes sp. NPDC051851 TaxID=3154753 RepID=UPI00341F4244
MTDPTEVHSPLARFWDVYFAVIAAAIAVAVLISGDTVPRRWTALGAIAGMVLLHGVIGRSLIRRNTEDAVSVSVLIVHMVLFAVALTAEPLTNWLLFALIPIIFQMAPVRVAIGLVILINLVPSAVDLLTGRPVAGDLIISGISAAAGVWFGLWIIRVIEQSNERARLIEELSASRAEVARLSHEAGVAAERTRLAGEIHDTLAQGFTSIITLVQAADPELRDERLALAVRTAKENLAESRAIVAALSPAALASGLLDSVRRQASRFAEETGVPASFRTTGAPRDLPTAVEVVLLRATQEALTNVRRHAAANEVAVLLAYAPESVRIVVRDDGRGFDAGLTGGFGLPGMRSRAEQVGGALTVHSDPDTGTTIELEVPL